MRQYKVTLALITIFAIMLGMYFIYDKYFYIDHKLEVINSKNSEEILKIDKNKLTQIDVLYDSRVFKFEKKNNQFVLVEPETIINVDKGAVGNLERSILELKSNRTIAKEGIEDLSPYGLKSAKIQVTVVLDDGTTKTLLVGNKTPSRDTYYAKLSKTNDIYTISKSVVESFMLDVGKIKSKEIFGFGPNSIKKICMKKDQDILYTVELKDKEIGKWNIIEPIQAEADVSKVYNILADISDIRICEFIADDVTDFSGYGLNSPVYSIELQLKDGTTARLLMGADKIKGKEIYCKTSNSDEIFVISYDDIKFIEKNSVEGLKARN